MQRTSSGSNKGSILILYGTQTGHAEGLARRLLALLASPALDVRLLSLDMYPAKQLLQEKARVIIVLSTFASGDFPESALGFWRELTHGVEWTSESLVSLECTLFGLGNAHTHGDFNAAAKRLDKRLLDLGAKHFYIVGYSNELDDDGHDSAFIPWCNGLKVKLRGVPDTSGGGTIRNESSSYSLKSPSDDPSLPYIVYTLPDQRPSVPGYTNVKLVSNVLLTPKDFDRGVYYCGLSLEDTPLKYKLCDYVAIVPRNKRGLVQAFLEYLSLLPDTMVVVTPQLGGVPFRMPQPIRISDLFEGYLDLYSRPTKYLMSVFATYATNEEEKRILHRISSNSSEWELFHREQYTIVDVLMSYSSIRFGLSELVSYIPVIKPRLYSICSSPKDNAHGLFFAYSHRNWRTPSGRNIKGGICTNFLSNITSNQESIGISIKRGTVKYSRHQVALPLIFMALGTGVGTALAILRERKHLQLEGEKLGPMILYFSGRNKDRDFLFGDELQQHLKSGTLTHLVTTFAYDFQPPQFIQVKIRQDPKLLWSYLSQPGCLYVYCGLGGPIPDEIEACIKECLLSCSDKDATELRAYISEMKANKLWIVENHTTISLKHSPAEGLLDSTELHEEIVVSPTDSKVIGGTPRRLAEWIMSKGDLFDMCSLLLSYRKFVETIDILHIFRDLYSASVTHADVKVINNLMLFLRQWATQYYRADFKSNELKQEFWQVVEIMAIPKHELTHSLGGVLSREGSTQMTHTESSSNISTLSLSKSASTSRLSASFLGSPPSLSQLSLQQKEEEKHVHRLSKHHIVTDFDEDLLFLELDHRVCSEFALIQPLELVDVAWQKKDKEKLAPNVLRLIKTFNDISGWTATEILTAPSTKQQTGALCHFIKIASIALEKRNFDIVMSILSGLNNYSVSRTHCLWDAVPAKIKEKLAIVQETMKIDSNFKKYRELLHASPNAMPYFALFLRDLAFAAENNDYFENGLINFEKSRILYNIVKEFQSYQKIPNTSYNSSSPTKSLSHLKDFLSHMDILEDQELYTHSIVIEPAKSTQRRSSKLDLISQVGVSLMNNCIANNVTAVRNLLKENLAGDVVRCQNQHGETALHVSASEGRSKLVRILLEAGAQVDIQNTAGNSALHLAASNNHLKVARVLVETGKANMLLLNEERQSCVDVAASRVRSYLEVERLRPLMNQMSQMTRSPSSKSEHIVWAESMSVGVTLFDNDHKQLIGAINLILSMQGNPQSMDAIGNTLDFLTHYTEFHFATEESLFAKYNYPSSAAHKKEHIRLTEQVKHYNKLHRKGKVSYPDLSKFLQGWLINHIMKEDMKYTDFFHGNGVF